MSRLLMMVLCLGVLSLMIPAMAESVKIGSYNVSFNMSQAHEVELGDQWIEVKTFDGPVSVAVVENGSVDYSHGTIKIDGVTAGLEISEQQDRNMVYWAKYFISGEDAVAIISSHMPFYDTADFLRSLHIKKEG